MDEEFIYEKQKKVVDILDDSYKGLYRIKEIIEDFYPIYLELYNTTVHKLKELLDNCSSELPIRCPCGSLYFKHEIEVVVKRGEQKRMGLRKVSQELEYVNHTSKHRYVCSKCGMELK